MDENAISLEPLPESGIDPQIKAALEPGEQVYWQARPQKGGIPPIVIFLVLFGLLVAWLEGIHDLAAVQEMLRELINDLVDFWQQLPWAFLLFSLLPIGVIYMFWPRQWRYALTDRRVLRLRSGKIAGQASPGKLIFPDIRVLSIRKRPDVGTVRWANSDFYDLDDRKRCLEFKNVRDPDKVTRMLKHWRQFWQDDQTRKAEASSESFRAAAVKPGAAEAPGPGAARSTTAKSDEADAVQRVVHPEHEFAIDVPATWDVEVQHQHDGPLRVLGITLIKRVTRPGTPRAFSPNDNRPWNRLMLKGKSSEGLNINIKPGGEENMPSEDEVRNSRVAKLLGVRVTSFEKGLDVNGFRGFSAERSLPEAGGEELSTGLITRQWWLSGHGLVLEIEGNAPKDSQALKDTLELVVQSIRPEA